MPGFVLDGLNPVVRGERRRARDHVAQSPCDLRIAGLSRNVPSHRVRVHYLLSNQLQP